MLKNIVKKKNKCLHTNIIVTRDIKISNTTDIKRIKNEDGEIDNEINSIWTTEEPYLRRPLFVTIFCRDCKKNWSGKYENKFPKWIKDILETELEYWEKY